MQRFEQMRTMVDLEPEVRLGLKHRAVDDGVSMSYLVNRFCASGLGLDLKIKKKRPGPKRKAKPAR